MLAEFHSWQSYTFLVLVGLTAGLSGWGLWQVMFRLPTSMGRKVSAWHSYQQLYQKKLSKHFACWFGNNVAKAGDFLNPRVLDAIANRVNEIFDQRAPEFVDRLMEARGSLVWDNMPLKTKKRVYRWVRTNVPIIFHQTFVDLAPKIDEMVNIQKIIEHRLLDNPAILEQVYLKPTQRMMKWLIITSILWALFLGLVTLKLYSYESEPVLYMVYAMVVCGYATYFALRYIVKVYIPRGFTQSFTFGLPRLNRTVVSDGLVEVSINDLLDLESMEEDLLTGTYGSALSHEAVRQLRKRLDKPPVSLVIQTVIGADGYAALKLEMACLFHELLVEALTDRQLADEFRGPWKSLLEERLSALPGAQYRQYLDPALEGVFQPMVFSAVMGGAALGFWQWMLVLVESHLVN